MIRTMLPGTVVVYFKNGDWEEFENVTGIWVTNHQQPILVISIENRECTVAYLLDQIKYWVSGRIDEEDK